MIAMLTDPLMQRALLVALAVGLTAPVVGTYLVQRRMALMGDGIGHVALAGVAAGWLARTGADFAGRDDLAIPGAIVFSITAAVVIEIMRERGTTGADVVMAIFFYGGIATGVLLMAIAGGSGSTLLAYLFGSISTVTWGDVQSSVILAGVILALGLGMRPALFSVSHDPEFARSTGLPVRGLNIVVAILAAITITVSMRVVGVLLVSGLMIVPVAIAQVNARSFGRTMNTAMAIGATVCLTGLSITYWWDLQPGALIVVLTISLYALVAITHAVRSEFARKRPPSSIGNNQST